jgi:hypothetical protein
MRGTRVARVAGSGRVPRISLQDPRAERGQALLLWVATLLAVLGAAFVIGAVSRGLGARADHGSAADLAALAGARAMRDAYPHLFEPPLVHGRPNPFHIEREEYLMVGRRVAEATARRNGAHDIRV